MDEVDRAVEKEGKETTSNPIVTVATYLVHSNASVVASSRSNEHYRVSGRYDALRIIFAGVDDTPQHGASRFLRVINAHDHNYGNG